MRILIYTPAFYPNTGGVRNYQYDYMRTTEPE